MQTQDLIGNPTSAHLASAVRTLAITLGTLLAPAAVLADPGPPRGCGGQFGVGGCAPYLSTQLYAIGLNSVLYEYDRPTINVAGQGYQSALAATGNLVTGELTASVGADWGSSRIQAISGAADAFTFSFADGRSGFAEITARIIGGGTAFFAGRGPSGAADLWLRSPGGGSISELATGGDAGRSFQGGVNAPVGEQVGFNLNYWARYRVALNTPVQIDYFVRTFAYDGASFFIGGALSFDLAPGMTVRSYEGFLQSPVPEPSTYALMAAGLAIVGSMARRRGLPVSS